MAHLFVEAADRKMALHSLQSHLFILYLSLTQPISLKEESCRSGTPHTGHRLTGELLYPYPRQP